jgi:hypothetical protein
MNPKFLKATVKWSLSLATAALIGYTIKLENKVQDRIDERFETES